MIKHEDFMPHLYESPITAPVHPKWGMKALAIATIVKAFLILLLLTLIIIMFAVLMAIFRTPYK